MTTSEKIAALRAIYAAVRLYDPSHDDAYTVQAHTAGAELRNALVEPAPVPTSAWPSQITEEMHQAACKVLTRATGLDGTPQRMLDAMLATAPVREPAPEPVAWNGLTDVQWMNIVNKNSAWLGYSVEDAVHEAVRLTEARLKANNVTPVREPAPVPLLTHGEVWAIWNGEIGVDEMNQKDAFRFAGLIEALVRQKAGL